MPRSAEPELSREALLMRAQKRVDDKKASDKRRKYFQFVVLACVLVGVLAVFYSTSNDAATYFQHSYAYTTQNAAGGCTWAWNTAGNLYNTTHTGVSVWMSNITPTKAVDVPVAPPPPPPAEDPTNYTTTGGNKKAEEPTNYTTTGGKTNTADGPNGNTTGTDSETDSPSTVLRVLGDVAVFAGSFVGYACYFFATQG